MAGHQIAELRQYTLHPGRRQELIELFDREFLESQEDSEMAVLGQFRDLDRPDRFVWLRSFPDLEVRRSALESFYDGPVWARHRDAANRTMADSDDVLLLRPAEGTQLPGDPPMSGRPPVGVTDVPGSLISIDVHHLGAPGAAGVLDLYVREVEPVLAAAGSTRLALLQTDPGPNTFPRLPVREGEQVVVRVARFEDEEAHATFVDRLAGDQGWEGVRTRFEAGLAGPSQHLRLQPTARSLLR